MQEQITPLINTCVTLVAAMKLKYYITIAGYMCMHRCHE